MRKKKAIFLSVMLLLAVGVTALVASLTDRKSETEDMVCVTSFYPVYLLADAVAEGAEGVQVRNLTENHSGCLHDYTLTTRDMRLLSEAELFFVNGGGMELFLTKVAKDYKNLTMVDTSEGFAFLEGVEHNHAHHEDGTKEHEEEDHSGHVHELNAHLWLSIDGYLAQLSKVEEAFVAADPAQEALYRANAETCRGELLALQAEYEAVGEALSGEETVVFHEGFVYLLSMLGVETIHCLAMDADTQIAAGEAAEIMEECKLHDVTCLFVEEAYAETVADTFGTETGSETVVLDSITGDGAFLTEDEGLTGVSLYCERMRKNLEVIRQAYGLR